MMIERFRAAVCLAVVAVLLTPSTASARKRSRAKESDARLLMATLQHEGKERMDSVKRAFRAILEKGVVAAHPVEVARLRSAWRPLLLDRARFDTLMEAEGRNTDSLLVASQQLYADVAGQIVAARALLALHPDVITRFDEEFPAAARLLIREQLARLKAFQAMHPRGGSDAEEIKEMIGDLEGLEANRWQLKLVTGMTRRSYFPAVILDSSAARDSASVALVGEAARYAVVAPERDFALAVVGEEMERWNREYWGEKLATYRRRIDAALSPRDRARVDSLRSELAGKMIATHWDDGEDVESIFDRATGITARYKSVLAPIRPALIDDIVRFNDIFPNRASAAIDAHRGEFSDDLIEDIYEEVLTTVTAYSAELGRDWATRMYSHLIEPGLMVAGTEDLLDLAVLSRLTRQIDWEEHSDASIDSISALSPTRSVKVSYALAEPDSDVTFAIRDRSGKSYGTFPQGARGSGRQETTLDCSAIADGTYLCVLRLGDESSNRTAMRLIHIAP
jgi:hypothetical protein